MEWYLTNGGLATSNNLLIHDLKTLRGVINRFNRYKCLNPGTWKIYSYTNLYDEKTYKLHATIERKPNR